MPFTLNTSVLGGINFASVDTILNERGRYLQIEWGQNSANQDIEIHGFAVRVLPAEGMAQE